MSVKSKAAQDLVPIKEIRDGIVILKDGSMRMLLMASSVNLALKSADEQSAVLMQFQSFLNSLEFSTQIFIQSRRLDVRPYLALLEDRHKKETNDLLKVQIREYINFIKTVTKMTNIMNKLFIIVVPFAPQRSVTATGGAAQGGFLDKLLGKKKGAAPGLTQDAVEAFEEARSQLDQRVGIVSQGLSRTGVRVVPLGTEEVTELYYHLFNPGEEEKRVTAA